MTGLVVPAQDNPLAEGLEHLPVHPTVMVLFGATGDLARRKLLPAIYELAHDGALPERFHLVGVARSGETSDEYRRQAATAIRRFSRRAPDEAVLQRLLDEVEYVAGAFADPGVYDRLGGILHHCDEVAGWPMNRCLYLATAPAFFATIVEELGAHGLARRADADVRVVVEKPFGRTLQEARQLNRRMLAVFEERQIFRIDHYLGKETVQNLLALRFANQLFEPVWNRNYVDHVQITAAEEVGVGSRAGFYDQTGALRDLIQNHLLQLLCHVAMEPPARFGADDVRNEKVKVLQAIRPPASWEIQRRAVRAQYGPGFVGGDAVPGYLEEEGVPPDSTTETYAALRLSVDNWRWAGVPFYVRTGKRLARKKTEIAVELRPVPHLSFAADGAAPVTPNTIVLSIQPDEGVSVSVAAKIPGPRMRLRSVLMQFLYGTTFLSDSPEAYERLLLDAMRGDATLFTRDDEVEAQWRICDPVLRAWEAMGGALPQYAAGSQGPEEAATILSPGHEWRMI
ncbi:MAG: glucose-6-phosphate 1-dehydrogenase [Baekduia sp.]|nr:glucose-6-phosphate 1-dehydrogenase [Baekduia sp.]